MNKVKDREAFGQFVATEHTGAHKDSGTYCYLKHGFQSGLAHARKEAKADVSKDSECGDYASLLPGSHYMDPPDGGSVSVFEQLQRMAKDAERWRYLMSNSSFLDCDSKQIGDLISPPYRRFYHDSPNWSLTLAGAIDDAMKVTG